MRDLVFHTLCFRIILLCTSLFVVQFSRTKLAVLADSLTIISPTIWFVNTFLKTFLIFFKLFSQGPTGCDSPRKGECDYYSIFSLFVNTFFAKNIVFSILAILHPSNPFFLHKSAEETHAFLRHIPLCNVRSEQQPFLCQTAPQTSKAHIHPS